MIASLIVDSKKLRDGMKMAEKFTSPSQKMPVFMYFEEGKLVISYESFEVSAPADGSWVGQVRIPSSITPLIEDSIPDGDESVQITLEDGRLKIGNSIIPCIWDERRWQRIQLAAGMPTWAILALKLKYTEGDIRRSRLEQKIAEAEEDRAERMKQAVEMLAPLGITESQLNELIDKRIRESVGAQ